MKKYVKYLLAAVLLIFACERDEAVSPVEFEVLSSEASAIHNACDITCEVEGVDGDTFKVRLLLGDNEDLSPLILKRLMQRQDDGSWKCRLEALTPATTYFYGFEVFSSKDSLLLSYRKSFTTRENQGLFVTTSDITDILSTTASCGGEVTMNMQQEVTARGVCWSTSQEPSVDNSKTTDGSGVGSFTSAITGLAAGETYYVRAYATSPLGTVYGNQRQFTTTTTTLPTVSTDPVANIEATSATCGGNVISDGGRPVTARGVCWSTSQNPTTSDRCVANGSGVGEFTSTLNGLTPRTTYYVRAYATNTHGTAYGAQRTFTTPPEVTITTPTVTTAPVSNIDATSATSGGDITTDGGAPVTARGVCWSTSQNPTTSGSHTTDGTGTGTFTSALSSLNAATTYYIRAYATNSAGTAYGGQRTFTTANPTTPTVVTTPATNITTSSATLGGQVTADGYAAVTARGICWSTNPNPTVYGDHTSNGSGTGSFSATVTNLAHSTTYYFRAYATNSQGTAYGQQQQFTTASIWIEGSVHGLFSVSATQQVMFSRGNLQYQSSTGIWRFAANQYTHEYDWANGLISSTTSQFFDLFGLGTSGYNNKHPWLSSTNTADYIRYTNIAGTHYDWGVHNAISNGGSQAGLWRILDTNEWKYLLYTRPGAASKRGLATVSVDVPGMVLLPDNWTLPDGCTFTPSHQTYSDNTYTAAQWTLMEQAGAVFLPACGLREGTECRHRSDQSTIYGGYYWVSNPVSGTSMYKFLSFGVSGGLGLYNYSNYYGLSVRLVHNHTP